MLKLLPKKSLSFSRNITFIFFVITLFSHPVCNSQTKSPTYKHLEDSYNKIPEDSLVLRNDIARSYIAKAQLNNDTIEIAKGYYFLSFTFDDPVLGVKYGDSIIDLTNSIYHQSYPAVGFFLRGYWNYQQGEYQRALHDYLKGDSLAHIRGNFKQQMQNRKMVAALKNRSGDYEGALSIYKEIYNSEKKEIGNGDFDHKSLNTLYNISLTYLLLKKVDSAKVFAIEGMNQSKSLQDTTYYNDFVFDLATIEYYDGNYEKSLNLIGQVFPNIDDYSKAMAYYYSGKIYEKQNDFETSIRFFEKTDSLAKILDYSFPELRDSYKSMVEYYEKLDDSHQQLYYINKILELDATLAHSKEMGIEIFTSYDTPLLLRKKEKLIDGLTKKNAVRSTSIILLTVILLILLTYIIIYRRRQIKYLKNYQLLLSEKELIKTQFKIIDNENDKRSETIPQDIFHKIDLGLQEFELKKGYLNAITQTDLAKELDTNTAYLSKTINQREGKNFSQYLNGLRIDYIISELKNDKKLRSYTINAIAVEIGFGTAQSFSKAFYQQTGIYPSYFIKKLNKAS